MGIKNVEIKSINDNIKFNKDSIKYLYTLSKNNFAIIGDKKNNVYLIKIINIITDNISKNSENFTLYADQTDFKIENQIYKSYDIFLNNKYNVKINEKTLERVKNYFR